MGAIAGNMVGNVAQDLFETNTAAFETGIRFLRRAVARAFKISATRCADGERQAIWQSRLCPTSGQNAAREQ